MKVKQLIEILKNQPEDYDINILHSGECDLSLVIDANAIDAYNTVALNYVEQHKNVGTYARHTGNITRVSEWLNGSSSIIMSEVQRNYVWSKTQALDLLDEIRSKGESFLGGVSFIRDTSNNAFIISDGCQRLTTLLLINKIYEASPAAYLKIQSNAIQLKYVSNSDTDQINKIMKANFSNINTEKDLKKKCLQEGLDAKKSTITKNFIALYKLYLADKNTIHLQAVKNNFLQSRLYGMEISQGSDEVDIFLNLNSKGTAIALEDMVKAYYPDDPTVDEKTYVNFNALRSKFNEKYGDKEFTTFLRRIHQYKENVISSSKAEDLNFYKYNVNAFADFKAYADMYENIRDRKYNEFWTKKNWPVVCSNFMFTVYEKNLIDKEAILDFICKWLYKNVPYISDLKNDHYSFQFQEGNVFDSLLKKLKVTGNISLNEVKTVLNNFNKSIPDWEEKTKEGLNYKSVGSSYIISVYNDLGYIKNNMTDWTVEHIWAQNCETGPTDEEHTHKLGNLTLLGKGRNSSAGKLAPMKKFNHESYRISGFGPTVDLMKMQQWTNKDIDERHEKFTDEWIAF